VVLEKKEDTTELQRGETAERDQNEETGNFVFHSPVFAQVFFFQLIVGTKFLLSPKAL
jgi:hypothetical protein